MGVLIPCFWHSRIQAGDLSSHLYNAWLGTEILAGRGAGLELAAQRSNVLFDQMLLRLMQWGGPGVAEHVSVAAAVLVLFWGAIAWIRSATDSDGLAWMPCVAMMAYGWVFHIGLFNYYIAVGLAFWVLALLWRPTVVRAGVAVVLLALAYTAHVLPVLWCCGVLAYVWTAGRLPERWRPWLPVVAIAAVIAGRLLLGLVVTVRSAPYQVMEIFGLDQVWVFGPKYALVAALLGMLWVWQAARLWRLRTPGRGIRNVPAQLCAVMAVVILVAPSQIEVPAYRMPLTFITERLTLPFAVLLCVAFSQMGTLARQRWALAAVTALQFSFLYVDTGALNWWEDRVTEALAAVPRGARVVGAIHDNGTRGLLWNHGLDRPCIGRCYSYQNYEPASLAFQVRARQPNPFVMHSARDTAAAEHGRYVARPEDLPLYQVVGCAGGRLCAEALTAGERMKAVDVRMVPEFW